MDVATIEMPPAQAARHAAEYRRALRRRLDTEYEAALAGYEALAAGSAVVDVVEAVGDGGFDEAGRPRLAIARADRERVRVSGEGGWYGHPERLCFSTRKRGSSGPQGNHLVITLPIRPPGRVHAGAAPVPMVPAKIRNTPGCGRLCDLYILWEVEEWGPSAPHDPLLLSPIHGTLYAVLAAWDLTPLERSVMAGRGEE